MPILHWAPLMGAYFRTFSPLGGADLDKTNLQVTPTPLMPMLLHVCGLGKTPPPRVGGECEGPSRPLAALIIIILLLLLNIHPFFSSTSRARKRTKFGTLLWNAHIYSQNIPRSLLSPRGSIAPPNLIISTAYHKVSSIDMKFGMHM